MKSIFAFKTRVIFRQILATVSAVIVFVAVIFLKIYTEAYSIATLLIHKIKIACDCAAMASFTMHPIVSGLIIFSGVVSFLSVGYAVYKLFRLLILTREFVNGYLVHEKKKSLKLKLIIAKLGFDGKRIIEMNGSRPAVFCFGFFRPKICVSNRLIKILHKNELEAVLVHEYQHLESYEPLKLFVAKYFRSIFFFLPGIKTLVEKFATFSELAADERATNNFTKREGLASALLKISSQEEKAIGRSNLVLSFFGLIIEDRVNRLTNNEYVPKFKFIGKSFLGGLIALAFAISLIFVFLSSGSKVLAMHNIDSCSMSNKTEAGKNCSLEKMPSSCLEKIVNSQNKLVCKID